MGWSVLHDSVQEIISDGGPVRWEVERPRGRADEELEDDRGWPGHSEHLWVPVRRRRGAPDPLRVRPTAYRRLLDRVSQSSGGEHWLTATVTDQATDADDFCAVNPLVAVRSKQTIGSFWYYPMLEVRQDPERLLTEALTGWRRVEGSEGWLLDHRATYSTDPGLRGPGGSLAVPGATWLATLAVNKFGYRRRNGVDTGPPDQLSFQRRTGPGPARSRLATRFPNPKPAVHNLHVPAAIGVRQRSVPAPGIYRGDGLPVTELPPNRTELACLPAVRLANS